MEKQIKYSEKLQVKINSQIRAKVEKGMDRLFEEKTKIANNLSANETSERYDKIVSKFHEVMETLEVL